VVDKDGRFRTDVGVKQRRVGGLVGDASAAPAEHAYEFVVGRAAGHAPQDRADRAFAAHGAEGRFAQPRAARCGTLRKARGSQRQAALVDAEPRFSGGGVQG
jgi:hypothetical protein